MNNLETKGAIVFLLQELDILSLREIKQALSDIFNYKITAGNLLKWVKHLQDRNIISIIYKNKYHMRKINYSEHDVAQVRDVVATNEIIKRNFEKWKKKLK